MHDNIADVIVPCYDILPVNAMDLELESYIRETLGVEIAPTLWPEAARLPVFLNDRYRFLRGMFFDRDVLFVVDDTADEPAPAMLRKHFDVIAGKWPGPVVYVRANISSYNRKRLISHRVPFVVPPYQMYLPDVGIDLRERFPQRHAVQQRLRPAAQAVLVSALLRENSQPLAAAVFAGELGYTPMTISRAFDELVAAGLAKTSMVARARHLSFAVPRREVWDLAEPVLQDPVHSRQFAKVLSDDPPGANALPGWGLHAGQSALANYAEIAEPRRPTTAVSQADARALADNRSVQLIPLPDDDAVEIEIWRYQPRPYRQIQDVDPLSLYLSMRNVSDERVQQALLQMMEGLPW